MTRLTMDKLEECAEWVLSYFDDDIERMRTYYENMLKSSDVYYNQKLKRKYSAILAFINILAGDE